MVQSNRRLYLKNLNMFVLRQFNSKINTTYLSMTVICLMLLMTIGVLSVTTSYNNSMQQMTSGLIPYDATFLSYDDPEHLDIGDTLDELAIPRDELFRESYEYKTWETGVSLYDALKPYEDAQPDSSLEIYRYVTIDALRLSDYNALARMQGAHELSLAQDRYAVVSVMENRRAIVDALLADGAVFELGGRRYTPAMSSSLTTALETSFGSGAPVYYILPDEAAVGLKPVMTALSANYSGDPDETDQKLISLVEELMENGAGQAGPDIEFASRTLVYQAVMGLKASLLFVSIYLGVIFLIASAAVLALQQLSEMSDNIGRYRLLRKLGVENRMMNRSILMQIFLSFFLPLSLAIVHSIVGIAAFNRSLNMFDSAAVLRGTIFSGLFLLAIYGGYFLFTYFSCKGMIKSGGRAE